mmetsp:Transcript_20496/g.35365  ORF Transcript_20496/g.35365 Transcript_20496/m.35365 type:complete len:82 (-) Transcript_20496:6-251(-)
MAFGESFLTCNRGDSSSIFISVAWVQTHALRTLNAAAVAIFSGLTLMKWFLDTKREGIRIEEEWQNDKYRCIRAQYFFLWF